MSDQAIAGTPGPGGLAAEPATAAPARPRILAQKIDVFGSILVALYFLSTAKWGSYLVPGPPYIGDLMIGGLLINRIMLVATRRTTPGGREVLVAGLGSALLIWTALRFAFGVFDVDAARDGAPYLYCVLAFLVVPLSDRDERRISPIVMGVLIFHLTWVTLAALLDPFPFEVLLPWVTEPGGGTSELFIFHLRQDIDAVACGALGAICLHRALCGQDQVRNLLLAGWALGVTVALLELRAGFLALSAELIIVILLSRKRVQFRELSSGDPNRKPADARLAVAAVLLLVPLIAVTLPQAPAVQELPQAFAPNAARQFDEESRGAGTANARLLAWERLVEWVSSDPGRMVAGTGFGPNYFVNSGAARLFSVHQYEEVRAPHNYWINTWARLGLIGLLISLLLWFAAMWLSFVVARDSPPHIRTTDLLAMMVAISLPVAASFGVLMESPFGAIPYFWAVGHLSVRARALGSSPGLPDLMHPGRRQPQTSP